DTSTYINNNSNDGDSSQIDDPANVSEFENVAKDDRRFYDELPVLPSQKRAAEGKIIDALFGNGVIYYEKLANYPLSKEAFVQLTTRFPENKFKIPTKYYLYKLNLQLGDSTKAIELKTDLITNHPNSEYAKLLNGKGKFEADYEVNQQLEAYYDNVYEASLKNNCSDVITNSLKADSLFTPNYLKPNFDYLRHVCEGKKLPDDQFIAKMQAIVTTYPTHNVANEAQNVIRYINRRQQLEKQRILDSTKLANDSIRKFVAKEELTKMLNIPYEYSEEGAFVYVIVVSNQIKTKDLSLAFSDFNRKYHRSKNLNVVPYQWTDKDKTVLTIQGLKDLRTAVAFHKGLISDSEFLEGLKIEEAPMSFASMPNFKLLIKAQSEKEYMQFFEVNYSSVIEEN
ncbi:MAG: hypothetical protein KDC92_17655, partial [Bacteroidetes bacterium]|nr:hypothetical protein [Bacteroidota bacterium]